MNEMIAYCGVDCASCADYINGKCPSCRLTQWTDDDICMPVKCCREKGIECCAFCDGFPCAEMAEFYEESDGHREAYQQMLGMIKIRLEPMTRERMHQMYQEFTMDPDIFMDMELYEKAKNYVYNPEKVDALFDMREAEEGSRAFAIMRGDEVIGEVGLRHADPETKECELSVHMKNDSVKNKGYGTEAERLAINYAFEELGMESIYAESNLKNTRSQHILEKMGFEYIGEEDIFKQYRLKRG